MRAYDGIPAGHIPDDLARQLKHGYYAAISYMDAQLGRVLEELDRLGLRDQTIIVLWGDHGWKLGEHDAWCKHTNVELDTNAPLILAVPGMKSAGRQTEALVEFVDIYPTLAELCGLARPAHLEGASFVPLLDDPDRPWKAAAFSQYPRNVRGQRLMGYSLRTATHRYTEWQDRRTGEIRDRELYDHRTDPSENVNVADAPGNVSLVAELSRRLKQGWRGALPPRD
jgi:arylsulfatase A-like enzyme